MGLDFFSPPGKKKVMIAFPFNHGYQHRRFAGESIGHPSRFQRIQAIANMFFNFHLNPAK
jgi:hypothetical protein